MRQKYLFLDNETTGLDAVRDKLYCISVAEEEDNVQSFGAWELPEWLGAKLADPTITKVGHNIRFDLRFLVHMGYTVRGRLYDTMLMAQLIDENRPLGLKPLSETILGVDSLRGKRKLDDAMQAAGCRNIGAFCEKDLLLPGHPNYPIIARYNREDVQNTLRLFYVFRDKLKEIDEKARRILSVLKTPLDYFKEEAAPTDIVLLAMETAGVRVDLGVIERLKTQAMKERDGYLIQLNELAREQIRAIEEDLYLEAVEKRKSPKGKANVQRQSEKYKTIFNWASGPHIGALVYDKFGLPANCTAGVRLTEKGAYDTSEKHLRNIETCLPATAPLRNLLSTYAKYKKTLKIINTYCGDENKGIVSHVRHVERNGETAPYIFGLYPQRTVTGRLSSTEPNLQNLKRDSWVKRFFVPSTPDHVFAYFDFSQIELRVAAHLSGDENLMEAYRTGKDLHRQTGSKVFGLDMANLSDEQRQVGKTINFLLIYDGSAWRLMEELRVKNQLDYSEEQCDEFRNNYFEFYKGYRSYLDSQLAFMKKRKMVISETGRIRRLPEIVYGEFLDDKRQVFTGPPDLQRKLILPEEFRSGQTPDVRELYWRAKRAYAHAVKQGYNSPNQGLAASIMKRALYRLHVAGYRIRTTVHDMVIVELHKSEIGKAEEIKKILETTYTLKVPLKAEMKLLTSFSEKDAYDPHFRRLSIAHSVK